MKRVIRRRVMFGKDNSASDLRGDTGHGSIIRLLLLYTCSFIVIAAGVYFMFLYQGKTFIRFGFVNNDSFAQRYMFLFEFRRFIENLFAGGTINTWDWSIGLGADAYSFNISNLFNPFTYIAAFAPDKYVDAVYSLTIVGRVYLCGFTTILFAKKIGLTDQQSMLGALMYTFSPWITMTSLAQGSFILACALLPLVLLGLEKVLRKESPVLFVLSVAYTTVVAFTFAYIIGIITVMYFFVRYFTAYLGGGAGRFFGRLGAVFGYGTMGLMVSGIGLVTTMLKFTNTTSTSGKVIPTLFTMEQYLRIPLRFITLSTVFEANSVIATTALGIIMIPVIIICFFKFRTCAVLTGILFGLSLIPYVSSVFNFFSYVSGRWFFVLAFFYSLAAAEAFDDKFLKDKRIQISITAVFVLYTAYLAWIQKILSPFHKTILIVNWSAAFLVLIAILLFYMGGDTKKEFALKARKFAPACVAFITMLGMVTAFNVRAFKNAEGYLEQGAADALISSSVQRIVDKIPDDDFYRVDQVGDILGDLDPHCKINEAMYYGSRSNYVFCSSVDNDWLTYNKLLGNSQGYYKRVAPNSNDDRFGLDLLQGTRYFIGDDLERGAEVDTTPYAAYGFEDQGLIGSVELMKNKYDIGLGCMFGKYMRMSEWLKLSYADREIAMLDAVVIPDDQDAPEGTEEVKAEDLKTGVTEAEYKVSDMNRRGTKFTISCENDDDHALIISFKNVRSSSNGRVTIHVDNGRIRKTAVNTLKDARGFHDIKDLTFSIGSGKKAAEKLSVRLVPNGKNVATDKVFYDDIVIYKVPVRIYDKLAGRLEKRKFDVTSFGEDMIRGTMDTGESGVLYLSVPDDDGWEVKVDGKKAKIRKAVDVAFMGIDLKPGTHSIEIEYHTASFLPGAALSLAGLVLLITALILRRRKKKQDRLEQ